MPEAIPESRPIAGWLFLGAGRRMHQEPHDLIVAGGVYRMDPVAFRWWGPEPSESACDAVLNARGPICCRVRAWGEVVRGRDRFVASFARIEWMADASDVLRRFAEGSGSLCGVDPWCTAARAIRMAMPARDQEDDKKPGIKAQRERAERAARDRLDERLAGMLDGLKPGGDDAGLPAMGDGAGQGRHAGDRAGELRSPMGRAGVVGGGPATKLHRDGR